MLTLNSQRGFTLIEVITVVLIMFMIGGIVLALVGEVRGKSRDAARLYDLRQIANALEVYRQVHGAYPDTGGNPVLIGSNATVDNALLESLSEIPLDPLNDGTHQYRYDANGVSGCTISGAIVYATRLEVETGDAKGCSLSGNPYVVFPG